MTHFSGKSVSTQQEIDAEIARASSAEYLDVRLGTVTVIGNPADGARLSPRERAEQRKGRRTW